MSHTMHKSLKVFVICSLLSSSLAYSEDGFVWGATNKTRDVFIEALIKDLYSVAKKFCIGAKNSETDKIDHEVANTLWDKKESFEGNQKKVKLLEKTDHKCDPKTCKKCLLIKETKENLENAINKTVIEYLTAANKTAANKLTE